MAYKKSEQTRSTILRVAGSLFWKQGYHNTSIRQIAAESDLMSPSTLYYYFPAKEDIAYEIFDKYFSKVVAYAAQIVPYDSDALLQLFVSMKLHYMSVLFTKAGTNFYTEILQYEWIVDDVSIKQNYFFMKRIASDYKITIGDDLMYLYFIESRGAEYRLFKEYTKEDTRLTGSLLINHMLKLISREFEIDSKIINRTIERSDQILKDVNISNFALLNEFNVK